MKRWGPLLLLVLVWGAVFAIPRTRGYALGIYEKCASKGLLIDNSVLGDEHRVTLPADALAAITQRLSAQYPNDKNLQTVQALDRPQKEDPRPLEQLAKQHPSDPLPLAVELRDCLSPYHGRMEGPLNNPNYPGKPPATGALAEADKAKFRRAVQVAQSGQQLAPDNTLFDWHLIYSLFALRRDKEALEVLAAAAKKTGFHDYASGELTARYNALSLERAPSPAETISMTVTTSFVFMARTREVARLVMEQAIAARQRGDKAAAVRYGYDLMKLGRTLRTNSQTLIGALTAQAIEQIAILAVQVTPAGGRRARSPALWRADNLAGLAASVGERKIAAEVMSEWAILRKWRAVKWPFKDMSYGVPSRIFRSFCFLDEASYFLFATTRWMLFLWVLLPLGSFLLRSRLSTGGMIATRAAVWGGITGLFALAAMLAADIAVAMRVQDSSGGFTMGYYGSGGLADYASWWIAGFPVIAVVATGLWLTLRWQRSQTPTPTDVKQELEVLGAEHPANLAVQRFFPVLAKWSVGLAVVGGLIGYFGFLTPNEDNFRYSSVLLVVLSLGLWGAQVLAMLRRPRRRETFGMALLNVRSALGGYLLVTWLCLGLVLLAALPGLREFDTQFQGYMREGEMVQLRAMAGL